MQQQRILIGKGLEQQEGQAPHATLSLPCPCTGQPNVYVLTPAGLLEVNQYKGKHSSWLVGERVQSDGGLFLATPVDVLLVLLPLLEAGPGCTQTPASAAKQPASGGGPRPQARMYCDLDTLLGQHEAAWPGVAALGGLAAPALPCVCDVKADGGGGSYYRFSEDKAAAWLRCKARHALAGFRSAGASSIGGMDEGAALGYVLGYLAEYLPPAWAARLAEQLAVQATGMPGAAAGAGTAGALRPADPNAQPSAEKKAKVAPIDPVALARQKAEATRAANAKIKLARAGEGSRKISSFFGGGGGSGEKKPAL